MGFLVGCAASESVRELRPAAACVGRLESCAAVDAPWRSVADTAELDPLLPHARGRTIGSIVVRYPVPAGVEAVRLEGAPHGMRAAYAGADAAPYLLAEGALAPRLRAAPRDGQALLVEVTAAPVRALWRFRVDAGPFDALEADTQRRVIGPTTIAVAALVVGCLQLAAALERRNRRGALLVAGLAFAMAARSVVMQNHWTHWWPLAAYPLAHAIEFATIPILGLFAASFYRWVAGLDPREPRFLWFARLALASIPLGAVFPAESGLTAFTLRFLQAIAVWAAIEIARAMRVAVRRIDAAERRLVLLGVGTMIASFLVDLAVSQTTRPYLLGIGALPPGFLVEMLCQSLIVAKRSSRAHDRVDELASVLESKNAELETANGLLAGANEKLEDSNRILAAELEERRRVQGELDVATQQLTQAENMATLGMLMAGIAHDLRNPLNYVQGAAEQLRDAIPELRSDDEARREKSISRVEKVVGWVEQGTASMDAISLAMRNQARGGGANFEAVALREVIDEALLLCRSRTKVCEVEVDVEEATVHADPTGLGQLVMNLVSNAADALTEAHAKDPRQAMAVLVRARRMGETFVVEVHDSGPGIPEPMRAKILAPFFSTKPRGQGTGLGLAIVQRVVKQHGGTLEIDTSDELGGARFAARWEPA